MADSDTDEDINWEKMRVRIIWFCLAFGIYPVIGLAMRFAMAPGLAKEPHHSDLFGIPRVIPFIVGSIIYAVINFSMLGVIREYRHVITTIEKFALSLMTCGGLLIPLAIYYDEFVSEFYVAQAIARVIVWLVPGCLLLYEKTRSR